MRYLFLLFLIPFMACAQTRTVTVKSDGTLVSGSANLFSANSNLLNASVNLGSQNGNFVSSTNGDIYGHLKMIQIGDPSLSVVLDYRSGITSLSNADVGPWFILNPNGIWDIDNGGEDKVAWYYGTIVMPERLVVGNLIVTNGFTNTFGGDVAKVAVYADNSKALVASPTTSTELSYLVGLQGNLNTILTKTTNGSLAYVVGQSNAIIAYIVGDSNALSSRLIETNTALLQAIANLGTNTTNNAIGKISSLNGRGTNIALNGQTNIGIVVGPSWNFDTSGNLSAVGGTFSGDINVASGQTVFNASGDLVIGGNTVFSTSSGWNFGSGQWVVDIGSGLNSANSATTFYAPTYHNDSHITNSLSLWSIPGLNDFTLNIDSRELIKSTSSGADIAIGAGVNTITINPANNTTILGTITATNITDKITTASNALYLLQSAGISNGNVLYVDSVNGNDSTGIRGRVDKPFTTINMAKTNALAGDTVIVLPGRYTNQTLSKIGINYYFYPGAVVTNLNLSIFTDGNVATTNIIAGSGDFHYYNSTFPSPDMVAISNSATRLTFKAHYVTCANNDGVSGQMNGFMVRNCSRVDIDVDAYYDHKIDDGAIESNCNCVLWYAGEMHVNIRRCTTEFGYVAWAAGTSDNLYYDGQFARATLGPTFYNNGTHKMWIKVDQIISDVSIAVSGLGAAGSKMYVNAQKIIGNPCIDIESSTEAWIQSEKITAVNGGSSWVRLAAKSLAYVNCDHFEQEGAMTGPGFDISGTGTNYIRGGVACLTNLPAVQWLGSKTILDGIVFDVKSGSSTNADVWAFNTNGANSSLTLKSCILLSGGATNSIYATNAQTINAIGTVQITNANQNVSFNGTMVTSGGFSTIR